MTTSSMNKSIKPNSEKEMDGTREKSSIFYSNWWITMTDEGQVLICMATGDIKGFVCFSVPAAFFNMLPF